MDNRDKYDGLSDRQAELANAAGENAVISRPKCACYVRRLDQETSFQLRWGAHAETCPAYRRSLDPVDYANDELTRSHLQAYVLGGDIRPVKPWSN